MTCGVRTTCRDNTSQVDGSARPAAPRRCFSKEASAAAKGTCRRAITASWTVRTTRVFRLDFGRINLGKASRRLLWFEARYRPKPTSACPGEACRFADSATGFAERHSGSGSGHPRPQWPQALVGQVFRTGQGMFAGNRRLKKFEFRRAGTPGRPRFGKLPNHGAAVHGHNLQWLYFNRFAKCLKFEHSLPKMVTSAKRSATNAILRLAERLSSGGPSLGRSPGAHKQRRPVNQG